MSFDFSSLPASLRIKSHLDELDVLINWFDHLDLSGIDDPFLPIEAKTALVEGFTNVVQHAHAQLSEKTPVEINVEMNGPALQIMIWDIGPFYDFSAAMNQLSGAAAQEFDPLRRECHWGQVLFLKLSRERGWQFTYDRLPDDRNCLSMVRTLMPS